MLRALALAALLAGLLLGPAGAAAQSAAELDERISTAREQAQRLAAAFEAHGDDLAATSARARAAAQREAVLSSLLAGGREREQRLAADVAGASTELERVRNRLRRATRTLSQRLVAIYKSGSPDGFGLLLQADGFDDLATRAQLLERIREADAAIVARVRGLRAEADARLADLRAARARAAEHNARLADAHARIASVRAEAERDAATLVEARNRRQQALERLRSQASAWTEQVAALESVPTGAARQTVAEWVGDWAIPHSIVICESGGNFQALNPTSGAGGAYQIMPSTWRAYGGKGLPHEASPAEQHRIAALIWRDSGASAWVC